MSRPESAASDRVSVVSGLTQHFPSNPLNVKPAPAYVAPAGAAQVVSEHRSTSARSPSDDEDGGPPSKKDVTFADPALALINQFLDQLLYSFLSSARSTSMAALRPAVTDVLKQRLAREAIMSAEEELAELLAGGDDEAEINSGNTVDNGRGWDTELVWKRTRLRVMVYIRLGEMEDDDEQRYVRDEELFHSSERRFSSTSGLVSWAAAIFLTSVLEYVAEQTLQVAGSAAHARVQRQARAGGAAAAAASHIVVEEYDVEKVALNSTLGRLWRTWRKSLRNHVNSGAAVPATEHSPSTPTSRETMHTPIDDGLGSLNVARAAESARPSTASSTGLAADNPELMYPEHVLAANIPLPLADVERDAHEIEVPGLAADPDMDDRLREILLSELALAAHTHLPVSSRDVHEIEVPGLARDVDDDDESQARHAERVHAAGIVLPIKDANRDVEEIEVPGLANDPDAEEENIAVPLARRNSFTYPRSTNMVGGWPTPDSSHSSSPVKEGRGMIRRRSSSVPTRGRMAMHSEDDTVPSVPEVAATATARKGIQDDVSRADQEDHEHSKDAGVVGAAVAGVAAAGAAVASVVFGTKKEEAESCDPNIDAQLKEQQIQAGSNKTAAEIEELDKRKSLLDIKALAGITSTTPPTASGRVTPETAGRTVPQGDAVAPAVAGTALDVKGRSSNESCTLGNSQRPSERVRAEEISSVEGPQDAEAIGVAQTSDLPFASPGTPEQDAREKRKPTRIVIDEEPPDSPTVKQLRGSTDGTSSRPRSFSRKSEISLTDQNRYVAQQLAQQRGIPDSLGESQRRRTQSSEQGAPYSPSMYSRHGSQVFEHPAVQRMASFKRSRPATDDQGHSLTSASIRGPEDFDMFVQGAETMKYTLTPEAVRDESVRSSAVTAEREAVTSPPASNADALRQLEAGAARDSREGRSRSGTQATTTAEEEEARKRQHRRSISRPATTNTKTYTRSGLMAREPRVQTESTRDFADFIRSTGPEKEAFVQPLMNNVSTTSLTSLRSAHINGASASRSTSPATSRTHSLKSGIGGENVPPVPPIPPTSKGAMQPRGANAVSPGNSDLIDFIRSGPVDKDKHRISRSVAPFRNTMDSEQFRDMDARLSGDKPMDSLGHHNNAQSVPSASQRTSTNSRSALLHGNGNPATAHPAYSGKPQTLASPPQPTPPMHNPPVHDPEPTKKRYRNKDPYAIDSSDEDDDLVTALPTSGPRKEESLMDFLNSMEPPKDTGPPEPLINPNSAQAKKLIQNAKANGGASSTRSLHGDGRSRTVQSNPGPRPGYASSINSARSNGSRPNPPGTQFTSTSISAGNAPRPKMVARTSDSRSQSNSTNDLASFLRDSGPPEDPESAPAPIVGRAKASSKPEKERKKSAFNLFGKSKKKTYLDVS